MAAPQRNSKNHFKTNVKTTKPLRTTNALRSIAGFGFKVLQLVLLLTLNPWRSAARGQVQVDKETNAV
jgi:hypothetical protein